MKRIRRILALLLTAVMCLAAAVAPADPAPRFLAAGTSMAQELNNALNNYVSTEFSDAMTQLEILQTAAMICARDFDYRENCSTAERMVHYGGGDCWASTDFILLLCRRFGIRAVARLGYKDSVGSGTLHRNVLAEIDGRLYIAEAGYGGTKPRRWNVNAVDDYSAKYDRYEAAVGVRLVQYERGVMDPSAIPETAVLPETVGGLPVLIVGYAFQEDNTVTKRVVLPGTVRCVSALAFKNNTRLREINLPEGLDVIGVQAFSGCGALDSITVPSTVTTVYDSAFASCGRLTVCFLSGNTCFEGNPFRGTTVTIRAPRHSAAAIYAKANGLTWQETGSVMTLLKGLTAVDERAFEGSAAEGVVIPAGTTVIGPRAFADCSRLRWIEIPATVTEIAADAFSGSPDIRIAAPSGSRAAAFAAGKGLPLVEIR
ncbi:MAG: leucine-rich repeat domain-containing protein [Clostridia bacterium]|nr:leucine-rich repeat domain-containing protein [Clostridia bacterium]